LKLQNLLSRTRCHGRAIMHAMWAVFVSGSLSAAYAMLLIGGGQSARAHAAEVSPAPATTPATAGDRLSGDGLFKAYVDWLHTAHAHAAAHGEQRLLPSQF
jgi:hypothetical protein